MSKTINENETANVNKPMLDNVGRMSDELYGEKMDILEKEYKEKKQKLHKEYALSNQKYNINDILQDHKSIIKVEKIKWGFGLTGGKPECVYAGYELTKKLEKKKSENIDHVYQSDVEKRIN